MDEHRWTMPARNSAEPAVDWRADQTGLWMDADLIGFPEVSREILRLAQIEEASRRRIEWLEAERRAALKGWEGTIPPRLDLEHEISLLRRERALLIELEKARTRILASIFNTGGGCSSEDVRQVGELLIAVAALHLEASGGVQRPAGAPCACVLCRPEGLAGKFQVNREKEN